MTMLTDPMRVLDELRECCGRQLNTRLIQLYGQEELDKGDEKKLLGLIKEVAVRGVHKELRRASFQGLKQQPGES